MDATARIGAIEILAPKKALVKMPGLIRLSLLALAGTSVATGSRYCWRHCCLDLCTRRLPGCQLTGYASYWVSPTLLPSGCIILPCVSSLLTSQKLDNRLFLEAVQSVVGFSIRATKGRRVSVYPATTGLGRHLAGSAAAQSPALSHLSRCEIGKLVLWDVL